MKYILGKKVKQDQLRENLELKSERVRYCYYGGDVDFYRKYLPLFGQGDNMAMQATTALNRIINEWYYTKEVYDNRYLKGLEGDDLSPCANWLYKYAADNRIRSIMFSMINQRDPDRYEYGLKLIHDYIMDEKLLAELEKSKTKGSIYNCEGPFNYKYYAECYD